jgi:hypothetical protein
MLVLQDTASNVECLLLRIEQPLNVRRKKVKKILLRAAKFFGLVASTLLSPSGKVIATGIPIAAVVALATIGHGQTPPSTQKSVRIHQGAPVHASYENVIGASGPSSARKTTPAGWSNIRSRGQASKLMPAMAPADQHEAQSPKGWGRLASGLRKISKPRKPSKSSAPSSSTGPAAPAEPNPPMHDPQLPAIPQEPPSQAAACDTEVAAAEGNGDPSCTPETAGQQPGDGQDPNEDVAAGPGENPVPPADVPVPPAAPSLPPPPPVDTTGQPDANITPPGDMPELPMTSGTPAPNPEAAGPEQPETDPVPPSELLEQLVDDFPLDPGEPSTPNGELPGSQDMPTRLQNASIPEPGTLALLGGGLLGLGWLRRKAK